eukprot:CAMPEP_0203756268 /NCGR_PEP_ID=MMETSP0098-20131031/9572_1 /ASSEMBLY_ACC=CAM_ASM_000208 /TAXON_ID=96639 /ORGANISM=" , Strain NY0313808BC1" /LENGTH=475 /DNA_ID=CAMNT_0050648071 /DNA_START=164 /DNA_END=1587 /DNA_ORIENTATION=+
MPPVTKKAKVATRIEHDSIGPVEVPEDVLYGAQTQRSIHNFPIGDLTTSRVPIELIHALAMIKKCCAVHNEKVGELDKTKSDAIVKAADEIIAGKWDDQFPLVIYQTGSGTQSNMNVNEVISNRANQILGGVLGSGAPVHPNDHVNMGQSSNDVIPTAMHLAILKKLKECTIPGLETLHKYLETKTKEFSSIIKMGRTHCQDATPLTLGQEFSGYTKQIEYAIERAKAAMPSLCRIALGGTAVGTGLNTLEGYGTEIAERISKESGLAIVTAPNKFEALAAHDSLVEVGGALTTIAVGLNKIGNDIRFLASGPRSGLGEITIPSNEPGSSIMPGKVNPTQCEMITMVAAKVMGNCNTCAIGGMQGQFELNVFKPLMFASIIESAHIIGDAAESFAIRLVSGIEPNKERLQELVDNSLMLVTALSPHIGYEASSKIAKAALKNGTKLREEALKTKLLTEQQYDQWVIPGNMTHPNP